MKRNAKSGSVNTLKLKHVSLRIRSRRLRRKPQMLLPRQHNLNLQSKTQ
jgi:hypothetical protein